MSAKKLQYVIYGIYRGMDTTAERGPERHHRQQKVLWFLKTNIYKYANQGTSIKGRD